MKRKAPKLPKFGVLGYNSTSTKTSRSQMSAAKKFFSKMEQPKGITFSDFEDGERSKKPIVHNEVKYDPNDPYFQIGEATERIGAIMNTFEKKSEEERFKELQELDTKYQISTLDSKQIIDESKKNVDELIFRNKELKDNQANELHDVTKWMKREHRNIVGENGDFDNISMSGLAIDGSFNQIDSLLSSRQTNSEKFEAAMKIHSEFAAKTFLQIRKLESTIYNKQKEIEDLKKINEELVAKGPKNRKNALKDDTDKQLEKALQKIVLQEETIKKLNTRIAELIGKTVMVGFEGDDNKSKEYDIDVLQNKNAFLEVKLQDQESLCSKLENQVLNLQNELEIVNADKALLETQKNGLEEANEIQKLKISKLENDLIIMQDKSSNGAAKPDLNPTIMLKERIKELEDEVKDVTEKSEKKLKIMTEGYKKQTYDMRKEYELREVELRNRIMEERANKTNEMLMKSLEDNYERKFEIQEKQYQEKLKLMTEELRETYESDRKKSAEEIDKLKQMLSMKYTENENSQMLAMHLKEEREKREKREQEMKSLYAEKVTELQDRYQSYIKKLENENKQKTEEIERLKKDLENEYNKEDLMFVQKSARLAEEEVNKTDEEIKKEEEKADVEKNKEGEQQFDSVQFAQAMEKKFLRRLNKQKEDLDRAWNAEMEKANQKLIESEESEEKLKQQLLELQSQLEDNNREEELEEEVRALKNDLVNKCEEAEVLQKQINRLERENKIFAETKEAFNNDDILSTLNQQLMNLTEEIEAEKGEKEKYENLYNQVTKELYNSTKKVPIIDLDLSFDKFIVCSMTPAKKKLENEEIGQQLILSTSKDIIMSIMPKKGEKQDLELSHPSVIVNSKLVERPPLFLSTVQTQISVEADEKKETSLHSIEIETPKPLVYLSECDPLFERYEAINRTESIQTDKLNSIELGDTDSFEINSAKRNLKLISPNPIADIFTLIKDAKEDEKPSVSYSVQETNTINEKSNALTSPRNASIEFGEAFTSTKDLIKRSDVAVMAKSDDEQRLVSLDFLPNIEVITIEGEQITPEFAPFVDPNIPTFGEEEEKKSESITLMTEEGVCLDIPSVNEITTETEHSSVAYAEKQRIDEAKNLSKKLSLVISEMQSIDNEQNKEKKLHLQNSLGVTLNIEKDSLISQMKERITELEEMNKRHTSNLTIDNINEYSVQPEIQTAQQNNEEPELLQKSSQVTRPSTVSYNTMSEQTTPVVQSRKDKESQKQIENEREDAEIQFNQSYDTQFTQTISDKVEMIDNMTQTHKEVVNEVKIAPKAQNANIKLLSLENAFSTTIRGVEKNQISTETEVIRRENIGVSFNPKSLRVVISNKLPTKKIVSTLEKVCDYDVISSKPTKDPQMEVFQKQRAQINELKQQLSILQSTQDPNKLNETQKKLIDALEATSENIESITPKGVQIPLEKESEITISAHNALKTARDITSKILDSSTNFTKEQQGLISEVHEAIANFSEDKENKENPAEKSSFIRRIGSLTMDLATANSKIKAELLEQDPLNAAFDKALEQIKAQENEIQDLKSKLHYMTYSKTAPDGSTLIRKVQSELEELIYGNPKKNKLFQDKDQAYNVIGESCHRSKNNSLVKAVGASNIVDNVEKQAKNRTPQLTNMLRDLDSVVGMLNEHAQSKMSSSIANDLRTRIRDLEESLHRQQTEKVIAQRDINVLKQQFANERNHLQKRIADLENQAQILERHLNSHKKESGTALQEAEESEKMLNSKLLEANEDIKKEQQKNEELTKKYEQMKTRFDSLFNQATDSETSNKELKGRVEEIISNSEIQKRKAREFESLADNLSSQLDELSDQFTEQMVKNNDLQIKIEEQKAVIEDMRQQLLDKTAAVVISKAPSDTAKVIKIYKDRIAEIQQRIQEKSNEYSLLKQQRVLDQKSSIQLRREIQRLSSELRISKLRYESAKNEIVTINKSIFSRDETIKMLKREISRLRELLRKQGPIKQNIKAIENMKFQAEERIQKAKKEIKSIENVRKRTTQTIHTSKYFENMLDRQRATLARLEKQREEIRNREKESRLLCMDAMSHLVKESETLIPEEIVLKYMPKPQPSRKLNAMRESRKQVLLDLENIEKRNPSKYETKPSYVDQLEILGNMTGNVDSATLKGLIRDARHGQIVIPIQTKKPKNSSYTRSARV